MISFCILPCVLISYLQMVPCRTFHIIDMLLSSTHLMNTIKSQYPRFPAYEAATATVVVAASLVLHYACQPLALVSASSAP